MTEPRTDAISPMELLAAMERGCRLTCRLRESPRWNVSQAGWWTDWELDGLAIPHTPGRALLWSGEIRVSAIAEGLAIYSVNQ